MAKRHRWATVDPDLEIAECRCGAQRFPDSGITLYCQPDGTITRTAGPCEPKEKDPTNEN